MAGYDEQLCIRLKQGDCVAFRRIYDDLHRPLFFVAKKYLKDDGLAEDAVQDTFLKLWNKRQSLDPGRSVRAFLFTILKNHVLNMIRDKKEEVYLGYQPVDAHLKSRNYTEEEITYREYERLVEKGLNELSQRRRKVFALKQFEGLTNAEVAQKFSVSVHTVKCQFYHSKKFMQQYIEKLIKE